MSCRYSASRVELNGKLLPYARCPIATLSSEPRVISRANRRPVKQKSLSKMTR
jgi:hypothetical protein